MATIYRVFFCYLRRFRPVSTEPPEAIKEVFKLYSDEVGLMGINHLLDFLIQVQGVKDPTLEMVQGIVGKYKDFKFYRRGNAGISLNGFYRYLFSEDNPPISPLVHHDMTQPLSHYFIYTGHNSYLTGNQLNSDCSDIPIIKSLKNGVRVIELDLWPAKDKDVYVHHGRTLTTPIELIKCLRSIKEHAFSYASQYPLIITLEDHLDADLQAVAAKMMHQTFGEMLFVPETLRELPSPKSLMRRIIISTKPPKRRETDFDEEDLVDEGEGEWLDELSDVTTATSVGSKDELDLSHHNGDFDEKHMKPYKHPEYRRLIAIPARKKKAGFEESFKDDPEKVTRLSLSEQALEKAAESYGTEIVRFTQRNLLRIYPKGTRVMSSNYNPLLGWMHGAQMVASNMQGYGKWLFLVHGMFRANGGCGYVRKPDILLDDHSIFNPKATLFVKKILKVRVYKGDGWRFDFTSTYFDLFSPPDFYAKLNIYGVPADKAKRKTKAIEDNWTPVWDEEFLFDLRVPELALLQIKVNEYDMSEKDDFAGQTCLPVSELKTGIRAVPLFNRKGEKLPSVKLLMRFELIDV